MKKITILTILLALALTLSACGTATKDKEVQPTQLGTSAFSIVLPEGYVAAEDEFEEDQIAYYYTDDNSVDFDVYQWEKGDQYTLEAEANAFASDYGTVPEEVVI